MIPLLFVICLTTSTVTSASNLHKNDTTTETPTTAKEILKASETGDPTKVEIVKQIRRLNDDGSYTIGYEANDGTFKIESRDVRGNVKGTFGYVDDDGEIKRVTYSSNGESTPIPVSTTTTMSTPMMVVRVNKTVSTTRKPTTTIVYPTRSSATTRGTVIQAIPRRRPISSSTRSTVAEPTTEMPKLQETTNILMFKSKDDISRTRTQISKPISATITNDLIAKSTTIKPPQTLKPVYEEVTEREPDVTKTNGIRRQLSGTSYNPHMVSLQQSMGDDSTDVYGGHLSHGTVRPLFTTTPRSRLLPIHSLINSRQRSQQYQEIQNEEDVAETSTGRLYDQQNIVTSNPAQVVHIPAQREHERFYSQPVYQRPSAAIHFRTNEYMRDNPGSPIPIGNQRPFLQYELQDKILEERVLKGHQKANDHVQYDVRPVTRIIPIPVDDRGVPIQEYQARYVDAYRTPVQRYDPYEEMHAIRAPVSTRDFRRLLQILILRQNRLQGLMDQLMPNPYHNLPYRREDYQPRYYQEEDRYEYRRDPQYRQRDEVYSSQNYDQYESHRYVPRRSYRPYDSITSATNNLDEPSEYLPVEVREALLLKMLILAISPDYMPTAAPSTELTTAAPTRKQVRNVQILGEEVANNSKTPQ